MGPQSRWVNKFEVKPGRWVFVPTPAEMEYGRGLIGYLSRYWSFPRYYYHLREGGHVAALESHIRHKYFCCLDIENFFGAISRNRITRLLKGCLGYSAAREIATRSTVKVNSDGQVVYCLPFGFPQSPFLASLALRESRLGKVLHDLSMQNIFNVSVYVDDILISSDSMASLSCAFADVIGAAERSGFKLHEDKLQKPRESVLSFNIELSCGSLMITDVRMRAFALDYMASDSDFQREGIVNYIKSVNPAQVVDLFNLLSIV